MVCKTILIKKKKKKKDYSEYLIGIIFIFMTFNQKMLCKYNIFRSVPQVMLVYKCLRSYQSMSSIRGYSNFFLFSICFLSSLIIMGKLLTSQGKINRLISDNSNFLGCLK